jgi:hypothetical protein
VIDDAPARHVTTQFPIRQKPASFSLDTVMQQLSSPKQ